MIKRALLLSCATGALGAWASQAGAATATATAEASASTSSAVAEIVVTAEKREQALQTVPIAITAFTSKERDQVGINSIQDMTNFTPGLTYSTSTDRITLRGVGRTTNVLSADAPVANYDDDLYETFAVAAGRSSLDLATVEILRGPQGTLGGRNALAGALNEITVRPTDTLTGEAATSSFEQKLEELWAVDVRSTIQLSRDIGARMKEQGSGLILTMGWDQAETGMEGDSGQLFAAAKSAVMGFTRSLALSLAPQVRVNCLAPGWIKTAWGEKASEIWQERVVRETPLQRWGTPEDVAGTARWLASREARFITGQVIRINGGAIR